MRLLDFGCARESADGEATLTIALKHGYAPVEQYQSKGQGPWTDVYALAATIYYCLTGRKPPQAMDRLVEDELVTPRNLGVDLTERQERALLHGMGVTPRRRFQSVQELHAALYEGGNWERQEQERLDQERREQERITAQLEQERQRAAQIQTEQAGPPGWIKQAAAWLQKNRAAAAGIAAALVLVAAVLLWRPWADGGGPSGSSPGEDPLPPLEPAVSDPIDSDGTPEPGEPRALTDEESAALFEGAVQLTPADEYVQRQRLRQLLEDPEVTAITLSGNIGTDNIDGPLEINKPVRVEAGSSVGFCYPVVIGPGGHLRVEGQMHQEGMVRTTGGGSILAAPGCELFSDGFIWLEHETELVRLPGAVVDINQDRLITVSEEDLFAGAVHVRTLGEYDAAIEDEGVSAIVVDADMTFTGHNRGHDIPVRISEGVTVTAPVYDSFYENNETEDYCAWDINGSILVNRGTLRGRIVMGDWDGDRTRDTALLLNYGTICADVYCDEEANNGGGCYVAVNLGTLSIPLGQLRGGISVCNLGTILHGSIAPEGQTQMTLAPEADHNYYLDIIGSWLYNAGELYMEGAGDWRREAYLSVQGGSTLVNTGAVRLGAWSKLSNDSSIYNYGEICSAADIAGIDNRAFLLCGGVNSVLDMPQGFYNVGLLQYGSLVGEVSVPELASDGGGALPFVWSDCELDDPGRRDVFNEIGLRQSMADGLCDTVIVCGHITLTEDLEVTKGLVIKNIGSLDASGVNLHVAGEAAYLMADFPEAVNLGGGTLTVRDGAVAAVTGWQDNACGGINLESDGKLFLLGSWEPEQGAEISVSRSYLNAVQALTLRNAQVQIQQGVLRMCGDTNLYGCTVDVGSPGEPYGEMLISGGTANFDRDTTVTVYGGLDISGVHTQELAGTIDGYGRLGFSGNECISGHVISRGSLHIWGYPEMRIRVIGTLENYGTVEIEYGGMFQPWAAGIVTGVPEEYVER